MFAFLLPLFFRISLVRGSVFLPWVAIPNSCAPGREAVRLPSFSLSTSVGNMRCNNAVLELKHFKHFLFCFEPMSIKWILAKKDKQSNTFQIQQLFLASPPCIFAASVMLSSHNTLVRMEWHCPEFLLFTPGPLWLFLQCHCHRDDIIMDQHPAQKEEEFNLVLHW